MKAFCERQILNPFRFRDGVVPLKAPDPIGFRTEEAVLSTREITPNLLFFSIFMRHA